MKKQTKNIVNFLFEVGMLSKTPRSGFHFLGSGQQSVAEHTNRTVYIGYVLSIMNGAADNAKVMKMCLLHDLIEARTSDLNYVHQKYAEADEYKALEDLVNTLPFGKDIESTLLEYSERKSIESTLAKDADNLEWILSLKEETDTGNTRAQDWIPSAVKRLKTTEAKELAKTIIKTNSDEWWFANKEDEWWINRSKKATKKRI